jgi:chemosensory pili system protein ChpA (sensor histidine kinase/response regulator)
MVASKSTLTSSGFYDDVSQWVWCAPRVHAYMPQSPIKTVLIVDDSRFFRTATERVLVRSGYTVVSASDGEEALRVARDKLPSLILLDMLLPKLDGAGVLHQLKGDSTTAKIPVLVLTSLSQRNEEKLVKDGAAGFLEKDQLTKDPQPLLQAIARLLL